MDPPPGAPRVNRARLNVFVRCSQISSGNWLLEPGLNWSTECDPGFEDMARGKYHLRRGVEVFKKLKGLEPIPFKRKRLQRQ